MKPVIGIVICGLTNERQKDGQEEWQRERQFVSQPYIHAIEHAGGIPLILPLVKDAGCYDTYTSVCDGFLFCGGDDITPLLFGEEPLTAVGQTDIKTDIFHIAFMEHVLAFDKPVLAICRGMQILNVAMGGTIYQDLSLIPGEPLQHMQLSQNRSDISHKVYIRKDSILCNLFGNGIYTNSFHHQAVHLLGEHLSASGLTRDSLIEAIESDAHTFVVGVQWHPECMYKTSPDMRNLFQFFLAAAS